MRALLIDPTTRTITEIDLAPGLNAIYAAMECHRIASPTRGLNGSLREGFDTLYANDDDLLEPGEDPSLREHWQSNPYDWYQVDAERNPPTSYPLSGRGLVVGIDKQGRGCDARISLDELKVRVTFTRRKFRGFDVKPGRGAIGDAMTELVRVEPKVPLIEEK